MSYVLVPLRILGFLGLLLWAGLVQGVPCQNDFPPSNPDSVYVGHGNGTVTDTRTGLMWKQCAEGHSGEGCQNGSLLRLTWADAIAQAETTSFAGYADWRLPNVKELASLVEECRVSPTVNTNLFPNTSGTFWSSSPNVVSASRAWYVRFLDGAVRPDLRGTTYHVRLVRGGQ